MVLFDPLRHNGKETRFVENVHCRAVGRFVTVKVDGENTVRYCIMQCLGCTREFPLATSVFLPFEPSKLVSYARTEKCLLDKSLPQSQQVLMEFLKT